MTSTNIQIFENVDFGKVRIIEMNGEPWFVGKDVATILGYKETAKAIRTHVDEEDKGVSVLDTPGGKQEVIIINESGLYSLILSSKLPSAKEFKHWVTADVLPSIRKTGKYSAYKEPNESTQARLINAKVRFARELQRLANIETLSPTYKQILIAQAAEALTGVPMELPKSTGKMYSAGEVGKMFGVSANKIGKLANAHNMKTDEFGAWYHDKSPYSSHEVDTFRYNDKAVEKFREIIGKEDTT
jgi:prophage antirepressor-like protein